jgi:hypothetical protein
MLGMLPIVLAGYAVGVTGLLREIAIVLVAALPLVWFICALARIQIRSRFVVLSARSSLLRWPVVGFVCHRSLCLVDAHVRCRTQYVVAAWEWGLVKDPCDGVHPACRPWITESLRFLERQNSRATSCAIDDMGSAGPMFKAAKHLSAGDRRQPMVGAWEIVLFGSKKPKPSLNAAHWLHLWFSGSRGRHDKETVRSTTCRFAAATTQHLHRKTQIPV